MKAAVFHGAKSGLKLEEIPVPRPAADEVRVRVAACGVCHTDLHYIDHGVPTRHDPPLVLGHEAAGWVDAIGERVEGFAKGRPVLVPAVLTCGACTLCRTGRANICEHMQMLGNHIHGAFAEYVCVPARDLVPIPEGLDPVEASIVADAVTTAYHAVTQRALVRAGDTVAVFGCGGVGLSAVQFAAIAGAHVIAVDLDEKKLELAKLLGAADSVCARSEPDAAKSIKKRTNGGVDRALECIGNAATIQAAHASLRPGGRLCVVGFCDRPVELPLGKIMFTEQEVVGSLGCRPVDFPRVLGMAASGRFKLAPLITARRPLADIQLALDDLRAGRSVRSVILMPDAGSARTPSRAG
jgi:6-hydroxycyclohex-1-ene-1-carbonyl-CoA dehydrogenase